MYARDLTQAEWVKTDCAAALDQTGIDDTANSASSLTATSANATAIQSITDSSTQRTFSTFVKRLSGTGPVEFTQNNGGTWHEITLTNDWVRVETAATLADPDVGFRITESGDSIAVDYCQEETGDSASNPIYTEDSPASRGGDEPEVSDLSQIDFEQDAFTFVIEGFVPREDGDFHWVLSLNDGTTDNRHFVAFISNGDDIRYGVVEDGDADNLLDLPHGLSVGDRFKICVSYGDGEQIIACNGDEIEVAATSLPPPPVDRLFPGRHTNNIIRFDDNFIGINHLPRKVSSAEALVLSTL